jgi:hypothetical protein
MIVEEIRKLMNDHPVLVDVLGMVDRDAADKVGIFYRKLYRFRNRILKT